LGRRRELAETYHNIAITHRDRGSFDEADECERRAIDYASDSAAPRVAAMGRVGRAEIALRRGDPQFAASTASRAAAELNELHDPLNEADALRLVGAAAAAMSHFDDAHEAFARALVLTRERGHAVVEAETLRDRALTYEQQSAHVDARADAVAACAIFERLGASAELEALKSRFDIP
jgi:tetratricopeptide (TPR) repeat protein